MATFDVCATVTVAPGAGFTWNNPYAQKVKVQAAQNTTWPLPQSSYIIAANNGQQAITLPIAAGIGTYNVSVMYDTIAGGTPCTGVGANPRIIVSTTSPKP